RTILRNRRNITSGRAFEIKHEDFHLKASSIPGRGREILSFQRNNRAEEKRLSVELNEEEGQYRSNLVRNWPATHELNPFVSRKTGRTSRKEGRGERKPTKETPKKELE
ncbi:hypothetical protein K0M31_011837, partial [Melipona bicolor]